MDALEGNYLIGLVNEFVFSLIPAMKFDNLILIQIQIN